MRKSVGIIPYKVVDGDVMFFVGHPGGFMDDYWTYMKGGMESGEDEIDTALREFAEESGVDLSGYKSSFVYLGEVMQNKRKKVSAFAVKVDNIDPTECHSVKHGNSGTLEIDGYRWMSFDTLKSKTHEKHKQFYEKIIHEVNKRK